MANQTSLIPAAWALAKKDLRGIVRDRTAMVLTILVPIALVTVFGGIMAYAFGGSGAMPQVTLHVADLSSTERSDRFIESLAKSEMLKVRRVAIEESASDAEAIEQIRKLVEDGDAHHVLAIPSSFESDLKAGTTPNLAMFRDPMRPMEDRVVQISVMQATISELGGNVFADAMDRILSDQGMDSETLGTIRDQMNGIGDSIGDFFDEQEAQESLAEPPADAPAADLPAESSETGSSTVDSPEPSSNALDLNSMFDFMQQMVPMETTDISPPTRPRQVTFQQAQSVAGMTVMMLLFALTSCGSVLLSEREEGTLKRLFAQPIARNSILLGKFIFVFIVGLVQISILFLYGEVMFRVGLFQDPVTLVVLSLTWVATGGAFGMFLASVSRSSKQAESLASLLILMMAALGGCWFPLQLMTLPPFLEAICKSTMTYWAMSGFQGMLWNQLPWYSEKTLIALGWQWGWMLLFTGLSIFFFRRNFCRG